MSYRGKLIFVILIFPVLMAIFAFWGGFFSGSLEQYVGMFTGAILGIHLCWYLTERWDAERLRSVEHENVSFLSRDEALLGHGAFIFVALAVVASILGMDLSAIYGPFSAFLVVIGCGYVVARLIIQR
ncbi:hypothetical protein K2Z83_27250 [Oscillochloris sp. ZM17-4]|uniref:hypothetical protein n=1 Tax=Oscillochloris sp. ZM17-4 TaxID=2866714 RepID=UPI001C7317B3|nr:hypothetical protein [Oscillochloris sp. ZM17-4]MBX0331353.1 hypothetical protein [Oscillochloris sp. ZM17-4]